MDRDQCDSPKSLPKVQCDSSAKAKSAESESASWLASPKSRPNTLISEELAWNRRNIHVDGWQHPYSHKSGCRVSDRFPVRGKIMRKTNHAYFCTAFRAFGRNWNSFWGNAGTVFLLRRFAFEHTIPSCVIRRSTIQHCVPTPLSPRLSDSKRFPVIFSSGRVLRG